MSNYPIRENAAKICERKAAIDQAMLASAPEMGEQQPVHSASGQSGGQTDA